MALELSLGTCTLVQPQLITNVRILMRLKINCKLIDHFGEGYKFKDFACHSWLSFFPRKDSQVAFIFAPVRLSVRPSVCHTLQSRLIDRSSAF